ncbi:hypothetical protein E4T56_gene16489 [Termitomyces sp. T112]|nr:hypothetical protein E4T56_gene16489 [Termitomyces sp. T112]
MKSCLNPAMTLGESHSNASPRLTSPPPPNNQAGPGHPLTPPPEPPPSLPPNQSPSGPTPPPRPLPAWAKPPPCLLPLPTTTPGPLHYAVNAPPATSPPSPSPAATLEADPRASAPTRLELMRMLWRHLQENPVLPHPTWPQT